MNADIFARITGVNINLTSLVEFQEKDMAEFTAFIKRDVLSAQHNIRINDVKEKYQLLKLAHRSGILEKLWKTLVMIIAIFISIFVIVIIGKLIYKNCDFGRRRNMPPVRDYQLSRVKPKINIPIQETEQEELDS